MEKDQVTARFVRFGQVAEQLQPALSASPASEGLQEQYAQECGSGRSAALHITGKGCDVAAVCRLEGSEFVVCLLSGHGLCKAAALLYAMAMANKAGEIRFHTWRKGLARMLKEWYPRLCEGRPGGERIYKVEVNGRLVKRKQ